MLSVVAEEAAQADRRMDLEELAREGARRMLATWPPMRPIGMSVVGGWWSATATLARARSRP